MAHKSKKSGPSDLLTRMIKYYDMEDAPQVEVEIIEAYEKARERNEKIRNARKPTPKKSDA